MGSLSVGGKPLALFKQEYNYVTSRKGVHIYNLGTGEGASVLQVIQAFSQASDKVSLLEQNFLIIRVSSDVQLHNK